MCKHYSPKQIETLTGKHKTIKRVPIDRYEFKHKIVYWKSNLADIIVRQFLYDISQGSYF